MYTEKGVYRPGDGVQVSMLESIKANALELVKVEDSLVRAELLHAIFNDVEGLRFRLDELKKESKAFDKRAIKAEREVERLKGMVYALEQKVVK